VEQKEGPPDCDPGGPEKSERKSPTTPAQLGKQEVRAKKREIALRYARKPLDRDLRDNLRRAELRRLYRDRYPGAMLGEIDQMIHTVSSRFLNRKADTVGNAVELSYEERTRLAIRTIQAFDKTPAEIAELQRQAKALRARERRQRERDAREVPRDLQTSAVPAVDLNDLPTLVRPVYYWVEKAEGTWVPAPEIVQWMLEWRDNRDVAVDTVRQRVHRAAKYLMAERLVEHRYVTWARGYRVLELRVPQPYDDLEENAE
jgi:hypothetical protein